MTFRRLTLCTLVLVAPVRVHAQMTAAVGLVIGYDRPFGHFDQAPATNLPAAPSDLRGPMWGGTVDLSLGRKFGIEAEVALAHGFVPEPPHPSAAGSNPFFGDTRFATDIATIEGAYDISPTPERYRLWLKAGPAFVRHSGDGYASYGNPTSLGGAAGASLVVPLGRQFQVVTDVTTLWYVYDVPTPDFARLNPGPFQHGVLHDALLQIGLRWGRL
jgi:hypothetical protein